MFAGGMGVGRAEKKLNMLSAGSNVAETPSKLRGRRVSV